MKAAETLLYRLPVYEQTLAASFRLSILVLVYNERDVVEARLRRVLDLKHDLIKGLELIVVDDCSTDGTRDVLRQLQNEGPRITLLFHEAHQGKGAMIRTALMHATGDIIIIHDADLEHNPEDIPSLLVPFAAEGADAVFGSRYLSAPYRRPPVCRHTMTNKIVTRLSNWSTDLDLTDIESGYKAINAMLLKSIPLRGDDLRLEVEIVSKLAKRRARIFEAPIRYLARTQKEGRKTRPFDGMVALAAIFRFWLIDDLYKEDEYGSHILVELERTRRFNLWIGETLRPFLGDRVLEIGAGIGNLTSQFIPREMYVASDINPNYLHYLRSYSFGKPYLRVMKIDAADRADFHGIEDQFDTVVMLNVLEHLADEQQALRNLWSSLQPGGRAIVLVPQHPQLYGTLDKALEHKKRYTPAEFEQSLIQAGFRIERMFDFNRFSVPGWWLNGKVLRRKKFSRIQLKIMDTLMPVLKRIDGLWPWTGVSVVAIAVKD